MGDALEAREEHRNKVRRLTNVKWRRVRDPRARFFIVAANDVSVAFPRRDIPSVENFRQTLEAREDTLKRNTGARGHVAGGE